MWYFVGTVYLKYFIEALNYVFKVYHIQNNIIRDQLKDLAKRKRDQAKPFNQKKRDQAKR